MDSGTGPVSTHRGTDGLLYSVRDGRLDFTANREWMDAPTEEIPVIGAVQETAADDGYNDANHCDPMSPED